MAGVCELQKPFSNPVISKAYCYPKKQYIYISHACPSHAVLFKILVCTCKKIPKLVIYQLLNYYKFDRYSLPDVNT